ncbi:MAG TPA: hypothetical protein VFI39_04580 [Gemmatimonadales bacterium]|nr:hypothetical protein [Gemmatimonadales bacterium]
MPWPGPVAFLDGVQQWEPVASAGVSPLVVADVAAAVRLREGRRFRTAVVRRDRVVIGRPEALALAGAALDGWTTLALSADEAPHPIGDLVLARAAVERRRGELEREVGRAFRAASADWLVVDGSLTESPEWAADARMIGVIKSHASLPFAGQDLETYLRLPARARSSVFRPASRVRAPVHSWALRLWPWEGKDLLYGLVRVEVAPSEEVTPRADEISRWLLAERAPVSTPDARWDRLLYGIHDVERYLRSER